MSTKPLVVDWKGLRKPAWSYSRAHMWRMFDPGSALCPKLCNPVEEFLAAQ
jgi:hypothetical protein